MLIPQKSRSSLQWVLRVFFLLDFLCLGNFGFVGMRVFSHGKLSQREYQGRPELCKIHKLKMSAESLFQSDISQLSSLVTESLTRRRDMLDKWEQEGTDCYRLLALMFHPFATTGNRLILK